MPKFDYAKELARQKTPVIDGVQYRAEEVKRMDVDDCDKCAAGKNSQLCEALPSCNKSKRLDGMNVVYKSCGMVRKEVGK